MHLIPNVYKSDQQEVLKALYRSMAYIEFDMDGVILNANKNYAAMSGYALKDLLGRNIKNLWHSGDLISPAYTDFWNKLKQGKIQTGTFKRQSKDGKTFWIKAVYQIVRNAQGTSEKIIAFCTDVTEHIRPMEEKLVRLDAVDRSLLTASYSLDGQFLEGNENFLSTLDCTEQELSGQYLTQILSSDVGGQENFADFWALVRAGHTASRRLRRISPNAAPIWLDSVFTPIFNSNGNVEKIIQISSDITRLVDAESHKDTLLGLFSNIVDNSGSAIAITNNNNKTIYANKAYTDMFGYTNAEIMGKFPTVIFGPEEKHFLREMRKQLATNSPYSGKIVGYCKNGKRLWLFARVAPIFNAEGKREYLVNIFTDITEMKLYESLQSKTLDGLTHDVPTEQLLELLCLEIEQIMPGLHVGVMGVNKSNGLDLLTTSYYPLKQLDSLNLNIEKCRYPACRAACSGATVTEPDIRASQFPAGVKRLFASLNINACLASAIKNSAGQIIGAVAFYHEEDVKTSHALGRLSEAMASLCAVIMERDENKAKMRMLTYYDPLTGLPNRNLLISGANRFLTSNSLTDNDTSFAVLYIDIDRFSRINQSYSYEHGNDVLRAMAGRLMNIKGKHDLIGRMFADEFVVIAPKCDAGQAFEKARRIQAELAKPLGFKDMDVLISASIGISLCPDNGTSLESLISDAGNCLLQSKSKGPGRVSFFNRDINMLTRTNLSLEAHLRKAIDNERLLLCYQPQIYLDSGKIYGVEALCRWNDKKCGMVPPDQFIPLAEETGLIEKLSDWVIREACRQLSQWRGKGLDVPLMSINLSAPSFHDTALPERIIACLRQFGLSPADIILELTERVLLDENPATLTTVHRAHEMGFALSLDDFGTGYSSLSYLRSLPFSEIKLDQSFVRDLHTTEVSRRVSEAVMRLGRSLKLTVLAEGVENMAQYRLLKQQNCHVAQGYLLSKPLPPKELENWITGWHPRAMADQHALL